MMGQTPIFTIWDLLIAIGTVLFLIYFPKLEKRAEERERQARLMEKENYNILMNLINTYKQVIAIDQSEFDKIHVDRDKVIGSLITRITDLRMELRDEQ